MDSVMSKASIRSSHVAKSRWKTAWCFLVSCVWAWACVRVSFVVVVVSLSTWSFCLPDNVASVYIYIYQYSC